MYQKSAAYLAAALADVGQQELWEARAVGERLEAPRRAQRCFNLMVAKRLGYYANKKGKRLCSLQPATYKNQMPASEHAQRVYPVAQRQDWHRRSVRVHGRPHPRPQRAGSRTAGSRGWSCTGGTRPGTPTTSRDSREKARNISGRRPIRKKLFGTNPSACSARSKTSSKSDNSSRLLGVTRGI